ncbi:hypothetical protein VNI00_007775 [Paramarasmius palmivorus]|uniref:DUF6699 domain-containing protein n=1 Tax=Paramarasmius palmivorus TaxID=297713 RepID=A0AAW0CZY7_9AGAR
MQPSPSASDTSTASASLSPPTARPSPSRGFSSVLFGPNPGARLSPAPSSTGSDLFIPPLSPSPPPPQPSSQPHTPGRRTMPLVGEAQGWAYPGPYPPMPYPPMPIMPPYTPYGAYPSTPYMPYGQTPYAMATPLPGYAAPPPQAPFQPTTIHNTPYASYTPLRPASYTPYAPPPAQLPSYSTPYAPPTQLGPSSTPYAPPPAPLPSYSTPYAPAPAQLPYAPPLQQPMLLQPSFLVIHPAVISLGLGSCSLDWDLLHPVSYCRLSTDPYSRRFLSEPIFSIHPSLRLKMSKLTITSSSHPNLAYWMDIWGPLSLSASPVPTIGDVLDHLHTYFRIPMSPGEINLLFQTPQNKENVLQAKRNRVKEGFDLVLAEEGYRRSDVLGVHRKFGGIWVGGIMDSEGGDPVEEGERLIEVELMVGVSPCTRA